MKNEYEDDEEDKETVDNFDLKSKNTQEEEASKLPQTDTEADKLAEQMREEELKKEKSKMTQPDLAQKQLSNKSLKVDIGNIEDFVAEINFLGRQLEKTNEQTQEIAKNVVVIQKLKEIENLDFNLINEKLKSQVEKLDFGLYVKEAVEEQIKPVLNQYQKQNDLLKNIIIEDNWKHLIVSKDEETIGQKIKKIIKKTLFGLALVGIGFGAGTLIDISSIKKSFENSFNDIKAEEKQEQTKSDSFDDIKVEEKKVQKKPPTDEFYYLKKAIL